MAKAEAIWSIDAGDFLEALVTLHMSDDDSQAFTLGKRYPVVRIHPLREPNPVAVVIDDSGQENKIDAEFLSNFRCVKATARS